MSLGLALSGGGAKGAAHIGVLQALKEEGINVDYISGTSSGSIVATLHACGYNPYNILYIFNNYCKYISDYDRMLPMKLIGMMFTGKLKIKGFVKGDNLEKLLKNFCGQKKIYKIEDITVPIAIPAVDINTGEIVYYMNRQINEQRNNIEEKKLYDDIPSYMYTGDIASIVRASCSVPGIFIPKILNKKLLVDGGIRINSPISILKSMGATKIISVSFDENLKEYNMNPNIIDITLKAFSIMGHQVNKCELDGADLVLRPSIKNVTLLDTKKTNYSATQGYNETKKNMDRIKEILNEK